MQPNRFKIRVLFAFAVTSLFAQLAPAQGFVPNRVLVKFKGGTSDARAESILTAFQTRTSKKLDRIDVHLVDLPSSAAANALLAALQKHPEVESAEFDKVVKPSDILPNDPLATSEWHLTKIGAPTAWATTQGMASVIIAILDTGVYTAHEDLASKYVAGWNVYDNTSNTTDVYGHGTEVAGVAAAGTNNGVGIPSVGFNCWFMPVRISDASGSTTYSLAASGLTWAADHGAKVANLSYMVSDSSTVTSAAQYFQSKGGVVVSSAGNYSTVSSSPINRYIMTISGTDPNDALYSWSNTGTNIDVAAPGCVSNSTLNGGGYGSVCGTSFSSPIVAGVAALVLSANSALSPAQVVNIIHNSADDLGPAGWDPAYGYGRVNAANAVALAASSTPVPSASISFSSPSAGSTLSGTVAVTGSASGGTISSITLTIDGVAVATFASSPFSYSWNTTSASNGSHTLVATVQSSGGSASTSITVSVNNIQQIPDTIAPVVSITSPAYGATVKANISVTVNATDNVGVKTAQLWVDGALTSTSSQAPFTMKLNTNSLAKGQHTLVVKAFDAAGNVGTSQPVVITR